VISRYLVIPAPIDDYLRQCDKSAVDTRRKTEETQGPQGNLRAILLSRAKAHEEVHAQAGQR
ncbi:hypothetical protein, partial [Bradyrhizobium sp. NBAIM08]|uniref:hypothetical protein n=1 Tax=Bradyrhizobium sp. NBAIM08 TaxID=2793815 RepID=UPI001CD332F0